MTIIIRLIKRFFYLFLDVSGSLLGVFLIVFGWQIASGASLSNSWRLIIVILGIGSLIVHGSHYIAARRYGSEYFYTTRRNKSYL